MTVPTTQESSGFELDWLKIRFWQPVRIMLLSWRKEKRRERKTRNSAYLLPLLLVFSCMGLNVFPQGAGIGVPLCTAGHLAHVWLLSKHKQTCTHARKHAHTQTQLDKQSEEEEACKRLSKHSSLTVSRCVRWCLALSLELLKALWQPGCWHR